MVGAFIRFATAAALSGLLASCAGISDTLPLNGEKGAIIQNDAPVQCVAYARAHSTIDIHGDAYTWWDKALGRFERGTVPKAGAILVLTGYAAASRGHLAIVRNIMSSREIRVDHANWLNDGAIYVDDPVEDVSAEGDWSQVRVWNIQSGGWGTRIYPVQGFIGPSPDSGRARVAVN